jgi:hypothetical protein
LFALNIKQQLLNEQSEIIAVNQMVGLLHEQLQTAIDYKIFVYDPQSLDARSENWGIPLEVTATINKNIDFINFYLIQTLAALSLSAEEVKSYENLKKAIFPVEIVYDFSKKIKSKTFYFRQQTSINVLKTLGEQWGFYSSLYIVKPDLIKLQAIQRESNGENGFIWTAWDKKLFIRPYPVGLKTNDFLWNIYLTLKEIEQLTNFTVSPRGIFSQFKHGGLVVYEENGHGLVVAISDIGKGDWEYATTICEESELNGYKDWYLPTTEDLRAIYKNLYSIGIGGFFTNGLYDIESYWSSTKYAPNQPFVLEKNGIGTRYNIGQGIVRPVRRF